jgi:hypothetical protein
MMQIGTRIRHAAVLACALVAMSAGLLVAATSAASASVDPPDSTNIFHTCTGIGNDGTNRGVVCADLWSEPDGDGTQYFGQNEVYCQNLKSRGYVTCSGIHETPAIGREFCTDELGSLCPPPSNETTFGGGQQICGTVFGHSACAARETVHVANPFTFEFFARPGPDTCSFHGESVRTSIRLPSGKNVSIEVLATPEHVVSCDDLSE